MQQFWVPKGPIDDQKKNTKNWNMTNMFFEQFFKMAANAYEFKNQLWSRDFIYALNHWKLQGDPSKKINI